MKSKQFVASFFAILVALISLFSHLVPQDKNDHHEMFHFFNRRFVKLGWAWTSIPLTLFAITGSKINTQAIRRVFNASVYWYLMAQIVFLKFYRHLNPYAYCLDTSSGSFIDHDYHQCKDPFTWKSFDISGHCFILIHASMLIIQELYLKNLNMRRSIVQRMLYVALHLVLAMWILMLIMTCIYYHSFEEKLAGTVFALIYWMV